MSHCLVNKFDAIIDKSFNSGVGVGIKDVLINPDSSLTILLTDGRSYTTPILKGKDASEDDSYLEDLEELEVDDYSQTFLGDLDF